MVDKFNFLQKTLSKLWFGGEGAKSIHVSIPFNAFGLIGTTSYNLKFLCT